MTRFVTTAIGREVPQQDWETLMRDLVLKVLHDFRLSPFNPDNVPMTVTELASASGLSQQEAQVAAEALERDHFLEPVLQAPLSVGYRITSQGLVFVRNAPQATASVW